MTASVEHQPKDVRPELKEAKYERFNFHRVDHLAQLQEILCSQAKHSPRVVLLSGERGIGRRFCLEAAVHLAAQTGEKIALLIFDLDGYEPDSVSLETFVNEQLVKVQQRSHEKRSQLLQNRKITLGIPGTASVETDVSFQDLLDIVSSKTDPYQGPKRKDREIFYALLRGLSTNNTLVLYVPDHTLLNINLRRWLADEVKINERLIFVFACRPQEEAKTIFPAANAVRLEFAPLTLDQLRMVMNERFSPKTFPDGLYEALLQYSLGLPGALAGKVVDLVRHDALYYEVPSGLWQLPEGGLTADAVVEQFKVGLYEPLDQLLSSFNAETEEQLRTFLSRAALCGENIPVKLLLQSMELSEEPLNTLWELIDDHLVGIMLPALFHDREDSHPAFPRHDIYTFTNPILRRILLTRVDDPEIHAAQLLSVLKEKLPVQTRGVARLFLELAHYLDNKQEREHYETTLAWWIGLDGVEELTSTIVRDLQEGDLTPAVLWQVVKGTEDTWPPYRRLALVEAYAQQPDGMPMPMLGDFYVTRARLLDQVGRYADALADAEAGLEVCEAESGLSSHLHQIADVINIDLAQFEAALPHLSRALAINEQTLGPNHPRTAATLHALGRLYHAQGNLTEAEPLYQRALAIKEQTLGPNHPRTAPTLHALGRLYHAQGNLTEAEPLYQRALAIKEQTLGPDHPDTAATLHELSHLYHDQDKLTDAEPLIRRALAITERVFGPDHPHVATVLENLAVLLEKAGRSEEATAATQSAEAIRKKQS